MFKETMIVVDRAGGWRTRVNIRLHLDHFSKKKKKERENQEKKQNKEMENKQKEEDGEDE